MPRYFFHLRQSGNRFDDKEGQLLRDPDEAWEIARATARTLMASDPGRQDVWIVSYFEVTDEDGGVVLDFAFVEAAEAKGELN